MTQGYYYGKYEYLLDEKNRLRLPSAFKDLLGENIKMGEGSGKFLVVYSENDFNKIVMNAEEKRKNEPSRSNDMKLRDIFSGIMEVKKDPQGRYLIPSELTSYANLSGSVLVIGNMDRVEIWSKENYEKRHTSDVAYSREDEIDMLQMEAQVAKEVEMQYRADRIRKKTLARLKKEFGENDD